MATLLPYCLGKVKGGEAGRRLSLRRYLCIIHPLSLSACGMCVDVLTGVCLCASMLVWVWVVVIG